jgi:seryl-tRNA synthetase
VIDLKEADLPVKMTAYSTLFQKRSRQFLERMFAGIKTRVHMFDKVEIVQLTHPGKSYEAHDEMVLHIEKLLQQL